LAPRDGKLAIHNKIFEERIYNYLIEQLELRAMASRFTNRLFLILAGPV
jgi:hypothetical protein